eukprot:TRINITY_DN3637_c0_g1_i16.p1 TRINITY_DN3637_c0_g1~~TRINITY_DN3637_c0_g1_i16.p1  ORF type:complete len:306 (+),score=79.42 TRINITY_DN3637_c0_g1_i16:179-1096(+)
MQNQGIQIIQTSNTSLLHPPSKQVEEQKSVLKERKQSHVYMGSKDPWTEEEEFKMIVAHRKYKNKWSSMTGLLKGRNNNTIKNKFYSVFRKIKGKVLKDDFTFDSKLELLETHYIISLIEYHLEHPTQHPKAKGKRGKDFIYSLIHSLTEEMVQSYKERMKALVKGRGDVEQLVKELTAEFSDDNGARTQHQTPAFNSSLPENKVKSIHIENHAVSETSNNSYNIEIEELLLSTPFRLPYPEISPILELGHFTPGQLLSPLPLSAGPAEAAARATQAACFGGFGDVSDAARLLVEDAVQKEAPAL